MLSHDSSVDPHTSQDAFPFCVIKNLVSVRLYSAPHLHLIIVIILSEHPSECLVTAGDAGIHEKIDKLFAGIENSGLHRALRDPDHLSDLFNRLLVVVEEVDDFAMDRRELGNAIAQDDVSLVTIQ